MASIYKMNAAKDIDVDKFVDIRDAEGNLDEKAYAAVVKAGEVTREELAAGIEVEGYGPYSVKLTDQQWRLFKEQINTVNESAHLLLESKFENISVIREQMEARIKDVRSPDGQQFDAKQMAVWVDISKKFEKIYRKAFTIAEIKTDEGGIPEEGTVRVKVDEKALGEAEAFIQNVTRAMYNTRKFNEWAGKTNYKTEVDAATGEDVKVVDEGGDKAVTPEQRKLISADDLASIRSVKMTKEQILHMQGIVQDLGVSSADMLNANRYAKQTILNHYIPLIRDGNYQVRQVAIAKDKDGKEYEVDLDDEFKAKTYYGRYKEMGNATAAADELASVWADKNGEPIVLRLRSKDPATGLAQDVDVTMRFEASTAENNQAGNTLIKYTDLLNTLERLSINLSPTERARLVKATTAQGSTARSNLMRQNKPGWDENVVKGISRHLETNAHLVGKNTFRHRFDEVINDHSMWVGDKNKLDAKYQLVLDAAPNSLERQRLMNEYRAYAKMYAESHPWGGGSAPKGITIKDPDGQRKDVYLEFKGRGQRAKDQAKTSLAFFSKDDNIINNTAGVLNGTIGSKLKTWTVMAHLGMSVSTSVINVAALATHTLSYLAYANKKTGFGGDHGLGTSARAIYKAVTKLGNWNLESADWIQTEIIDKGRWAEFDMTKREAEFLLEETKAGVLAPALGNALLGSARGKEGERATESIKAWMTTFNYTEQLNRRATLMASYKLESKRLREEAEEKGSNLESKEVRDAIHKKAAAAANKALTETQGDYSMYNRPDIFKGDLMQYVFMYKMFTLLSVNLLKNMGTGGKTSMLAMLLISSGIKGLPFADDIMDLIDTLAQMFGIKLAGVELEAYRIIESIAPGAAPYIMRGWLDQMTGGTMSSRLGMGNLLPGTGSLKHGADPWREAVDFAGPVFSVALDSMEWAFMASKYVGEVAGVRNDTTALNDLVRANPSAFFRAWGDAYAYIRDGNITNDRGQVVSQEVSMGTIIARALGFYPAAATRQFDAIRMSKFHTEHVKAIKGDWMKAALKAKQSGDSEGLREILRDVQQWNRDAPSDFKISNFNKSLQRAWDAARTPQATRALKALPKAARLQAQQDFAMIMGINT